MRPRPGCDKCATDLIGTDGGAGGNPPKASKIGFRKRFCNASYVSAVRHDVPRRDELLLSPSDWLF